MYIDKKSKNEVCINHKIHSFKSEKDFEFFLYKNKNVFNIFIEIPVLLLKSKITHLVYFLGGKIICNIDSEYEISKVIQNPMISYLKISNKSLIDKIKEPPSEINNVQNLTCYIDYNNIINLKQKSLLEIILPVWKLFSSYSIFNLPDDFSAKEEYFNLCESLGRIRVCHSVNDATSKFSKSRDIRYKPNTNHFFSSNSRQPLHTDYAYYIKEDSPEWLMLYCMEPSQFGGITSLLNTSTLSKILKEYRYDLYEKILNKMINYEYNGVDGNFIHKKKLFDGVNISWNYWQIKPGLNDSETMKIVEDLFDFLENIAVSGNIFDFSKEWKKNECIIFSDRVNLHCRSSFLGDRWLKDHAFFSKT